MAITSDSAKIKFYVGSFDYDTTISLPATSLENRFLLQWEGSIAPQLPSFNIDAQLLDVLFKITFEGEVIYENPQYADSSFMAAPTDPDVSINADENPEEITTYRDFAMVPSGTGVVSNGKYTVEAKFVYQNIANDIVFQEGTFIANLNFESKSPSLSEWYDQELPSLTITDSQDYMINGVTATTNTEFVLSPPQNRSETTNTYEDIQTVTYSSFWTGGNEMTYTVLIEYDFTSYIIIQAKQDYYQFPIYYMDWCATYDCLNELYNLAIGANCGTKQKSIYQDKWAQATSLIQQIQLGLGCGKSTISGLITQLNDVLDCSCGCLDDTPRQINSGNVVPISDIQFVTATEDETVIDLSAGSTVFLSLDADYGETDISVINFSENGTYKFIVTNVSNDLIQQANFDASIFSSPVGDVIIYAESEVIIYDFYAISGSEIVLDNSNISTSITSISAGAGLNIDTSNPFVPKVLFTSTTSAQLALAANSLQAGQGYVNYVQQNVEVTTGSTLINLALGNVVSLNVLNSNTELSVSNIVERKRYIFQIYSSTDKIATFDEDMFRDADGSIDPVIPSGVANTRTVLEFIGTNLGTPSLLLMSRSEAPLGTETIAATPSSLTTLNNTVNDKFVINATTNTEIDLADDSPSLGSRITIIISSATGNTVEFDNNIFFGSDGAIGLFTPTSEANSRNVLVFESANVGLSQPKFLLVSSNNIIEPFDPVSYQDLGVQSGAAPIDFSLGKNAYLSFSNNPITISALNFEVGETYSIHASNTGSTSQVVTFDGDIELGISGQSVVVPVGESVSFTLVCVDDGSVTLKKTGESLPPITQLLTSVESVYDPIHYVSLSTGEQYFQIDSDAASLVISTTTEEFIEDGKIYVFSIKATAGDLAVSFVSDYFIPPDQTSIPAINLGINEIATVTFIGAKTITGDDKMLLLSIEKPIPDIISYQDLSGITTDTTINFSLGANVFIRFANADFELDASNFIEGNIYHLLLSNNGVTDRTISFDFDNILLPNTPANEVLIPSGGNTFGVTFEAVDLVGNGDIYLVATSTDFPETLSYQDLGDITANQLIDFADGKSAYFDLTTGLSSITVTFDNITEGEVYNVVIRNTTGSSKDVDFAATYIPTATIDAGEVYGMTLLAVDVSGIPTLMITGSSIV
jgi:hypothetical protein